MVQRGRPTSAVSMVKRLKGTPMAKERVLVILENLGGSLPVSEACRKLSVSPALFHRHRMATLAAALRALEHRPPGRPVEIAPGESRRIRELEGKIVRLEEDLAFSRAREELALLIPWTRRRQKKSRLFPTFWRAGMLSRPPAGSSAVGATPGHGSPGGLG
jgi:hypothetical protein